VNLYTLCRSRDFVHTLRGKSRDLAYTVERLVTLCTLPGKSRDLAYTFPGNSRDLIYTLPGKSCDFVYLQVTKASTYSSW
jgi:hypothetical protein